MSTQFELDRIQTLLSYHIINTAPEQTFDELARLATISCQSPVCFITFIDSEKQYFKAVHGIHPEENHMKVSESFCQYTLNKKGYLEIHDSHLDDRVKHLGLVVNEPNIRHYAGYPIFSGDGFPLGTVCVVDFQPKAFTESHKIALEIVSKQVTELLTSRKEKKFGSHEIRNFLKSEIQDTKSKLISKEKEVNYLMKALNHSTSIIEIDPIGIILSINNNYAQLLGYDKSELIDQHINTILPSEQSDLNFTTWQEITSGTKKAGRTARKSKDGSLVHVHVSIISILDPKKEIRKVIELAQDASEESIIQSDDTKTKEVNHNLELTKDTFIKNFSHEVYTPLNAIIGFSKLLKEEQLDDTLKDYVESLSDASNSLMSTLKDLLDLSKIESGVFEYEAQTFHFRELIEQVFGQIQSKVSEKPVQCKLYIEQAIPNHLVGDRSRIKQILTHILNNAVKFTEKGQIQLKVVQTSVSEDQVELEFRVSDTGIGIPKELQNSIFNRFQQANNLHNRTHGGTGIGLNITKQLVEHLKGSIELQSIHSIGTSVTVHLPFEKSNQNNSKKTIMETSQQFERLQQTKILVCEDNTLNQKLMKNILNNLNMQYTICSNGIEALDALEQESYGLILMDIQMPEMDGYETTISIRNKLHLSIPIIALTAHSIAGEKEKCLRIGMNDYISKPFQVNQLLDKIEFYLSNKIQYMDSKQLIDFDYLAEFSGGNQDFETEIFKDFTETVPNKILEANNLLEHQQFSELKNIIHYLKSSFGVLGINIDVLKEFEQYLSEAEVTFKTAEHYMFQVNVLAFEVVLEINNNNITEQV